MAIMWWARQVNAKKISAGTLTLLLCLAAPIVCAQTKEGTDAPPKSIYSQVVERVFEFSKGIPAEFRDVQTRVVVRFLPSFGPESQVVILKKSGDRSRIVYYRLKPGSLPISELCNKTLEQNPDSRVEDIVGRVPMEIIERTADAATLKSVEDFGRLSVPMNLSADFCADGTTYLLWVQTVSNEIQASFSDCAYGAKTDANSVIRWMKALRASMHGRE